MVLFDLKHNIFIVHYHTTYVTYNACDTNWNFYSSAIVITALKVVSL